MHYIATIINYINQTQTDLELYTHNSIHMLSSTYFNIPLN